MGHHERAAPTCNFVEAFDEVAIKNAEPLAPLNATSPPCTAAVV